MVKPANHHHRGRGGGQGRCPQRALPTMIISTKWAQPSQCSQCLSPPRGLPRGGRGWQESTPKPCWSREGQSSLPQALELRPKSLPSPCPSQRHGVPTGATKPRELWRRRAGLGATWLTLMRSLRICGLHGTPYNPSLLGGFGGNEGWVDGSRLALREPPTGLGWFVPT